MPDACLTSEQGTQSIVDTGCSVSLHSSQSELESDDDEASPASAPAAGASAAAATVAVVAAVGAVVAGVASAG